MEKSATMVEFGCIHRRCLIYGSEGTKTRIVCQGRNDCRHLLQRLEAFVLRVSQLHEISNCATGTGLGWRSKTLLLALSAKLLDVFFVMLLAYVYPTPVLLFNLLSEERMLQTLLGRRTLIRVPLDHLQNEIKGVRRSIRDDGF